VGLPFFHAIYEDPRFPLFLSTIPHTMLTVSLIAVALAAVGANAQLTMNTPTGLIACQNSQLTWSGNTGPVQITVHPGGTTDPTLETLPQVASGNSVTWLVDQPSGVSYTFVIKDLTTGETKPSGQAPVGPNPNNDNACIGKNTQGDPSSGPTVSAPGGTVPTTSPPAGQPTASNPPPTGGSSPSASSPPGSSTPRPSGSNSAAPSTTAAPGDSAQSLAVSAVAGFVGIVAAVAALA
jgi:hypothetical protein